ncbi:hypothetical protein Ddc_17643 [Ditylenchus destructor]|nr:hypothetical protein Ddc_17643 [Ditylenchus destructor]
MTTDSRVTFANFDPAAKCIEKGTHKILEQNFCVQRNKPSKGARRKITEYLEQNLPHLPEENDVSAPNYQSNLPEGLTNRIIDLEERIVSITSTAVYLTNRIHVSGPCLHPMEDNARDHQREDLRTYFGQFGKIINIYVKPIFHDMMTDSRITFAHCDSAAKCLEQDNHKILGQNFRVERKQPSKGAKKKIKTEEKKKRKCRRP